MKQRHSGFTIVELLIVIVVIGILATITVLSYSGITARAKAAAAKSNAGTVAQKIQLYNVEHGAYPLSSDDLTGDTAKSASYYVTGITFAPEVPTSAPEDGNTITLQKCDNTDGETGGTGNKIIYWDSSTDAAVTVNVGSFTDCTNADS